MTLQAVRVNNVSSFLFDPKEIKQHSVQDASAFF